MRTSQSFVDSTAMRSAFSTCKLARPRKSSGNSPRVRSHASATALDDSTHRKLFTPSASFVRSEKPMAPTPAYISTTRAFFGTCRGMRLSNSPYASALACMKLPGR